MIFVIQKPCQGRDEDIHNGAKKSWRVLNLISQQFVEYNLL